MTDDVLGVITSLELELHDAREQVSRMRAALGALQMMSLELSETRRALREACEVLGAVAGESGVTRRFCAADLAMWRRIAGVP